MEKTNNYSNYAITDAQKPHDYDSNVCIYYIINKFVKHCIICISKLPRWGTLFWAWWGVRGRLGVRVSGSLWVLRTLPTGRQASRKKSNFWITPLLIARDLKFLSCLSNVCILKLHVGGVKWQQEILMHSSDCIDMQQQQHRCFVLYILLL